MRRSYPQAAEGTWWRDSTLWVQLCLQIVGFTILGSIFANASVWGIGKWAMRGYILGLVLAFAGLLLQRWKATAGLAVTAVGLGVVGATAVPSYPLAYALVCYEAWYINAFTLRRDRTAWLAVLVVGSFTSLIWGYLAQRWGGNVVPSPTELGAAGAVIVVLILVSVALASLLGRQTAHRNEQLEMLAARAELATVSERNRIAREMHDIVAHSLTVVIAQADGGRYAGRKDPGRAIEALDIIAEQGRSALSQMRSLLSVLHDGSADNRDTSLAPGVAGIPDLIFDAKRSGMKVSYAVQGLPSQLDEVRGLTVYRIVQESLTNVMKHAGPVEAQVMLQWEPERVTIRVDNRPGSAEMGGTGRGLTGIAERVRIHGGQARWGASALYAGGWNVTATLPLGR